MRREALARLQRDFLRDLTGRIVRSPPERASSFLPPRSGSIHDRWHIYSCGYLTRIIEVMGLEHPATLKILGPEAFSHMVARYLGARPPRSHDLSQAGESLPQFLEFDRLGTELPFLSDLTALERSVGRAFVAEDGEPWRWDELVRQSPEGLAALRLIVAPGVALNRSDWPVCDLWRCRLDEEDDIDLLVENRPQIALVRRAGFAVRVEELNAAEADLVELAQGSSPQVGELPVITAPPDRTRVFELLDALRSLFAKSVFVKPRARPRKGLAPKEVKR